MEDAKDTEKPTQFPSAVAWSVGSAYMQRRSCKQVSMLDRYMPRKRKGFRSRHHGMR